MRTMIAIVMLAIAVLSPSGPALSGPDGDMGGVGEMPDNYQTTSGDFDGDGIIDHARLVLADDGRTLLLVDMAGQSYVLNERSPALKREFLGLYVDRLSPGTYATACTKGYGDPCRADELREVTLVHDGLLYGTLESSGQLWYWTGEGFSQVWLFD